jgi:multiple sugar transport system ATP-binding protein
MDEPLSNLDAKLRVQMRAELVNLHQRLGVTTLYVTHDQVEAMTLGDRVAVMSKGVVQQLGTPQQLYYAPENTYVASFVGSPPMNFIPAVVAGGTLRLGGESAAAPSHWPTDAGEVLLGVRPEALQPGPAPDASRALEFDAAITMVEDLGSEQIVSLRSEHVVPTELADRPVELRGTLAMRTHARSGMRIDQRATVHADLDEIHLFDPATENALAHAREQAPVM